MTWRLPATVILGAPSSARRRPASTTRHRSRPRPPFRFASISKTVAATAIMRLVEQGRVDLSAPVRNYLPDFRAQGEAVSGAVTIQHLLTHTSGWEG
jgi:CubicO group peptidase (beta-lactamase class C family)